MGVFDLLRLAKPDARRPTVAQRRQREPPVKRVLRPASLVPGSTLPLERRQLLLRLGIVPVAKRIFSITQRPGTTTGPERKRKQNGDRLAAHHDLVPPLSTRHALRLLRRNLRRASVDGRRRLAAEAQRAQR